MAPARLYPGGILKLVIGFYVAACPQTAMAETRIQRDTVAEASLPWLPSAAWDSATLDEISAGTKVFPMSAQSPGAEPAPELTLAKAPAAVQTVPVAAAPPAGAPASISADPKPTDLTDPPGEDLRQQLWQEWAEKFQLVMKENAALREQANSCHQDEFQDIRVDSVASIENQALKSRIAELEKELEDVRAKKEHKAGNATDGSDSPLARKHAE